MNRTTKSLWIGTLCFAMVGMYGMARADHHGEHHEEHHDERRDDRRVAPPKFAAHAPGVHPHPAGRGHSIRVLAPRVVAYGNHNTWKHWGHPEFARPAYYWQWSGIRQVSCVAEDSYGDQYPVTENTFAGFGFANMSAVEDDALDRCNQESGGDTSCYLATCSHF